MRAHAHIRAWLTRLVPHPFPFAPPPKMLDLDKRRNKKDQETRSTGYTTNRMHTNATQPWCQGGSTQMSRSSHAGSQLHRLQQHHRACAFETVCKPSPALLFWRCSLLPASLTLIREAPEKK